jgi:hypothetical protein
MRGHIAAKEAEIYAATVTLFTFFMGFYGAHATILCTTCRDNDIKMADQRI